MWAAGAVSLTLTLTLALALALALAVALALALALTLAPSLVDVGAQLELAHGRLGDPLAGGARQLGDLADV